MTGTILIVDDDTIYLRLLTQLLTEAGYDVRPVTTGIEALGVLGHTCPDAILLDVQLSNEHGFSLINRLKCASKDATPIIFLSSRTDSSDKVAGLTLGAVDYIDKSADFAEILARVAVHVRRRGQALPVIKAGSPVLMADALASLPYAVLVADCEARIAFANDQAKKILAQDFGLGTAQGVLVCRDQDTTFELHVAIRKMCDLGRLMDHAPAPVHAPYISQTLWATIGPLVHSFKDPHEKRRGLGHCTVCLSTTAPLSCHSSYFRRIYNLTPAETDILALLLDGLPPKEIAAQQGISYETVRTHIRRILDK